MVNFRDIYHFSRFQRGSTIFQGVQLSPGGSNCLFPIETHITCDFPGGGPDPLSPPLDPHLELSIVIIPCEGFKALPYISHQTWASVVKEPDSVACEQQRYRPVWASGQSDACLCNLLPEKYIAKQLNLSH